MTCKRNAIILTCLAGYVSGCATTTPAPQIVPKPFYVDRPVPCVRQSDIPGVPGSLPPRPKAAQSALDIALAKVREWEGYGEKSDPLLKACAKPTEVKTAD